MAQTICEVVLRPWVATCPRTLHLQRRFGAAGQSARRGLGGIESRTEGTALSICLSRDRSRNTLPYVREFADGKRKCQIIAGSGESHGLTTRRHAERDTGCLGRLSVHDELAIGDVDDIRVSAGLTDLATVLRSRDDGATKVRGMIELG